MTGRQIHIVNKKILRWTILTWLLIVILCGYTSIHQDMTNELLAHTKHLLVWSILDFFLYQLPWWSLILISILGVELLFLRNPWKE